MLVTTGVLAAGMKLASRINQIVTGTLATFVLVSIGVIVLRRKRPDLERSFRVPFVPVPPIVAALVCFSLMLNLNLETWIRFVVWLAVGLLVHVVCSRRHSRLGLAEKREQAAAADAS